MLFDIEKNSFWREVWGDKPNSIQERKKIAEQCYLTYPKLIPVYSHRYIPASPELEGNPIFSVYQMDIIYYGNDLLHYFQEEFNLEKGRVSAYEEYPNRKIEFWSDIAEDEDLYE